MKEVFKKVIERVLNGETVAIIASRSVTRKDLYLFSRGCRYYIRTANDAYEIGMIKGGVFEVQNRFPFISYNNPKRYNRFLEFLAIRFQLDEQNEYVFVRAVFSTRNVHVDKEQLLAMTHAHQLEEISKKSYVERSYDKRMYEIYYRVDMKYLFKFCNALPDFREQVFSDKSVCLIKTDIRLEIDIDAAACHFYQNL